MGHLNSIPSCHSGTYLHQVLPFDRRPDYRFEILEKNPVTVRRLQHFGRRPRAKNPTHVLAREKKSALLACLWLSFLSTTHVAIVGPTKQDHQCVWDQCGGPPSTHFAKVLSNFWFQTKNAKPLYMIRPWVEFLSGPGAWWGVPQETCLPLSGQQQISWDTQVRTLQKRGIEHLGCAESGNLMLLFLVNMMFLVSFLIVSPRKTNKRCPTIWNCRFRGYFTKGSRASHQAWGKKSGGAVIRLMGNRSN